ncbi:MAG: hypothetical protein FWE28_01900 [Oscillospiraceae bacterium]|nr:hypothetical protein [Oscillospiraceae bacterium]
MVDRLLSYWYSLEFFQPSWPIKEKGAINLLKEELPWPPQNSDPNWQISYDIYIGCTITDDLISWVLNELNLTEDDFSVERDYSKCCLCAFKVDEDGVYVAESFSISSFTWALGAIVKAHDFNVVLDLGELEKLQARIHTVLSEDAEPFSLEKLQLFSMQICTEIGIEPGLVMPALWANKKSK